MNSLRDFLAGEESPPFPDGLAARLSSRREGVPHLSASAITQFMRCPEQFRRVKILGERQRPAAAMVWGSADHAAHETNFSQKIQTGLDISEDDLKLVFAECFDQAVERNGGEAEIDWEQAKPGELKDKGVALAATYHRLVSPRVQPLAVEERFEVTLPGVPVAVVGYVDVRAVVTPPAETILDAATGKTREPKRRLVERKTSARKVSELKPDWRLQGLLYQAVEDTPVDWHVSAKTKLPAVYTPAEEPGLTLPHNQAAVETAAAMVANSARAMAAYWDTFGPDEPWPGAVTYGWACGFCGFRESCAWWRYERSAA